MQALPRRVAVAVICISVAVVAAGCGSDGRGGADGDQGWRRFGSAEAGLSLMAPPDWVRLNRMNVDKWVAEQAIPEGDMRPLHSAVFNNAFIHGVFMVEPTSQGRTLIDASCLSPASEPYPPEKQLRTIKLAVEASGAQDIQGQLTTVAGMDGTRTTFNYPLARGDRYGTRYTFMHDGRVCNVLTLTDLPSEFDPIFLRVVESIQAEP